MKRPEKEVKSYEVVNSKGVRYGIFEGNNRGKQEAEKYLKRMNRKNPGEFKLL